MISNKNALRCRYLNTSSHYSNTFLLERIVRRTTSTYIHHKNLLSEIHFTHNSFIMYSEREGRKLVNINLKKKKKNSRKNSQNKALRTYITPTYHITSQNVLKLCVGKKAKRTANWKSLYTLLNTQLIWTIYVYKKLPFGSVCSINYGYHGK